MLVYFDQGNEGIDVKEGCLDTHIENNTISMQFDEDAGGTLADCRCSLRRLKTSDFVSRGGIICSINTKKQRQSWSLLS